jgi:hypothetical protein
VPVHGGMRWGIAVLEAGGGRPVETRVVAVAGKGATTKSSGGKVPWE